MRRRTRQQRQAQFRKTIRKIIRLHKASQEPWTARPRFIDQHIFNLLKERPGLTSAEIVASLKGNEGTIRNAISRLFNQGKIAIATSVGERRKYVFSEK